MPNVVLWIRAGDRDSDAALAFLKAHGYRADAVRDLATVPPTDEERRRLVAGLGGNADALLDARTGQVKAPLLLTPKGAMAGFRESRWRAFLDVGRGRA